MEKTRGIVSDVTVVDTTTNEELCLSGEMVFGRADADKNFPQDTLISRRHLRLVPAEGALLVEDLGSTNRTKLNGKLLKPGTLYKLKSRDLIEFGQQKFQVFLGGRVAIKGAGKIPKDEGPARHDRSMIFERTGFSVEPLHSSRPEAETSSQSGYDDALLHGLVQKKNAAWFLQYNGSEFGPFNLRELKKLVRNEQFQGGPLLAFTEGLADWLAIEKLARYIDEPV